MVTHYVYDDPDKVQLGQGDVLQRTDALVALLAQYHPHYAEHPDYKFFAVMTQSCDLVRRDDKLPKSPYITIAAARTLEETLLREAAKSQSNWQRQAKVIGMRDRDNLLMFLQRVIDNNEPGYFYLHEDQSVGIHRACCVVLPLGVSLRSQHYDLLLEAKIAQVKDTFQAKLDWLIGNMYSRVGTTEWNNEYPDRPVETVSKEVLEATLHSVRDEQIKEGLAELKHDGQLENKTPDEIFNHIRKKNILSRSKKFENRAAEVSKSVRLVNLIQGRVLTAMQDGDALKQSLRQILINAETSEESVDALTDQLVGAVNQRISEVMTDADLPGRNDIAVKFIRGLLQDPQIAAILK